MKWTQKGKDIDGSIENGKSGSLVTLSYDGSTVASRSTVIKEGIINFRIGVYRYKEDGSWGMLGNYIDGLEQNSQFQRNKNVSLSNDGNILAVGGDDQSGYGLGKVTVYKYNKITHLWETVGQEIVGLMQSNCTGYSVALSGNGKRLIVGSPGLDINVLGFVTVYEFGNGRWNDWPRIESLNILEEFGIDVSISHDGNTIAIGSSIVKQNSNSNNTYKRYEKNYISVYNYDNDNDKWSQVGLNINGEMMDQHASLNNYTLVGFTMAMSLDGKVLALSSRVIKDDSSLLSTNTIVITYNKKTSRWEMIGSKIMGEFYGDFTGASLSLNHDGKILAIGDTLNNGLTGIDSGNVRIYMFQRNNWVKLGTDIDGEAPGDMSGQSLSLSGDGKRVAIGAPMNDVSGFHINAGHVRVYDYTVNRKRFYDNALLVGTLAIGLGVGVGLME